ncbi:MAG: spermidine/putrescine ABC transporter substrate-binding protein, partial [Anaerostipes hadrus]|nr:spermidine/putrescine ABC transporter substrate-binding protein [Anaerostipes hadrus]
SGDAVYSMQQVAEEGVKLRYAVPDASTNLWFDGWCMLKNGIGKNKEKQQAAEAFVNYISRPDNVVRNMYYVGYTSVISGGNDKTIYDYVKYMYENNTKHQVDYNLNYFFKNKNDHFNYQIATCKETAQGQLYAQYPTKYVMKHSVIMTYFGDQANKKISRMWIDMRCFDPRIKKNSK